MITVSIKTRPSIKPDLIFDSASGCLVIPSRAFAITIAIAIAAATPTNAIARPAASAYIPFRSIAATKNHNLPPIINLFYFIF